MHKKTCQQLQDFCRSHNIDSFSSYFKRSAGGETYYSCFLPTTFKRLMVFAHGTGNDALYPHQFFFEQFLRQGIGIFTFDLDGHGANSTTVLNKDSFFSQLVDVKQEISNLEALEKQIFFVGYSLGGLLSWSRDIAFQSRHLIGTPFYLEANSASLVGELRILKNRDFLNQFKGINPLELVPAVGPFRRRSFPVRIQREESHSDLSLKSPFSYVEVVKSIFEAQAYHVGESDSEVATQFVYGQLDNIAPPTNFSRFHKQMLKKKFKSFDCFVDLNSSHLGLLYSRKVAEKVIEFHISKD